MIDVSNEKAPAPEEAPAAIERPWLLLAGPLFLLCTLGLAGKPGGEQLFLLGATLLGLFLCGYQSLKGCFYSVALLGLGSILHYSLSDAYSLWHFGLEGSVGCGLVVTALALEERKAGLKMHRTTLLAHESIISHLEDDLVKLQESSVAAQVALQDKADQLQKELEEREGDLASLSILNEVLRKTAAQQIAEKEEAAQKGVDQNRQIDSLLTEIDDLQKELLRVADLSHLNRENRRLLEELNRARVEKAQAILDREGVQRLVEREQEKARAAAEQMHEAMAERQKRTEELGGAKGEIQMLSTHLAQVSDELEKALTALKQAEKVQMERTFFAERVKQAEIELAGLHRRREEEMAGYESKLNQKEAAIQLLCQEKDRQAEEIRTQAAAELNRKAEERISKLEIQLAEREKILSQIEHERKELSEIDQLHKQLRIQFEEKNQILHQTRSELFRTETELKKLQIEKAQVELASEPLAPDIQEEILALEEEASQLRSENEHLQSLITHFFTDQNSSPVKKK